MELFFQQLLNGLTIGSVYSVVALGLTLVFGILHTPNFAHGAFYMVGAYITLMLMTHLGVHYWIGVIVSIIVVSLISILFERLIFHRLGNLEPMRVMVAAIGILLFFEAFALLVWGTDYRRMITPYESTVDVFGLTVTWLTFMSQPFEW